MAITSAFLEALTDEQNAYVTAADRWAQAHKAVMTRLLLLGLAAGFLTHVVKGVNIDRARRRWFSFVVVDAVMWITNSKRHCSSTLLRRAVRTLGG